MADFTGLVRKVEDDSFRIITEEDDDSRETHALNRENLETLKDEIDQVVSQ